MNTENKLTFELIAPYLPYGIQMQNGRFKGTIQSVLPETGGFKISCSDWHESFSDNKYLPILRPMSDYPKVIQDGVKNLDMSYRTVIEILKDHADIHGLIPKGLAISIHDIEKK